MYNSVTLNVFISMLQIVVSTKILFMKIEITYINYLVVCIYVAIIMKIKDKFNFLNNVLEIVVL